MDYDKNFDLLPAESQVYTISGTQYQVKTDLSIEPVDKDFFKEHARIDFDTDDTLIEVYIKAARMYLEKWAMLSFGVKTINLTAVCLPKNYRLMFGPVDTVTTADYTNTGDILKQGGHDIDIEFTTKATLFTDDVVKVAICRYAAGLYIQRENILETKFAPKSLIDESKVMLDPYRNIILF